METNIPIFDNCLTRPRGYCEKYGTQDRKLHECRKIQATSSKMGSGMNEDEYYLNTIIFKGSQTNLLTSKFRRKHGRYFFLLHWSKDSPD